MTEPSTLRVRDDVWTLRAAALLLVGVMFAGVGLLASAGASLTALGIVLAIFAVAVLLRGVGLEIEPQKQSMLLRRLTTHREIRFDDVSYVGIGSSRRDGSATPWGFLGGTRFDVVLNLRADEPVIVGRELTIEAARAVAARLGQLTGAAMSETGKENRHEDF
jgi:hypothetical protein